MLLLGLLCTSSTGDGNSPWALKKNEHGITVYTREVSGSSIRELKAITHFDSKLSPLITLIKDVPEHPAYIYRCQSARVIKAPNDHELYYYHDTYAPWPVDNRDIVIYYHISQDPRTKVVTIASHAVDGLVPETEGKVRVHDFKASWVLTPAKDGTVNGEYYLYVDPGGNVPAWLINLFVVDGPYNSILKMKELLAQEKYQSAKIPFIHD